MWQPLAKSFSLVFFRGLFYIHLLTYFSPFISFSSQVGYEVQWNQRPVRPWRVLNGARFQRWPALYFWVTLIHYSGAFAETKIVFEEGVNVRQTLAAALVCGGFYRCVIRGKWMAWSKHVDRSDVNRRGLHVVSCFLSHRERERETGSERERERVISSPSCLCKWGEKQQQLLTVLVASDCQWRRRSFGGKQAEARCQTKQPKHGISVLTETLSLLHTQWDFFKFSICLLVVMTELITGCFLWK